MKNDMKHGSMDMGKKYNSKAITTSATAKGNSIHSMPTHGEMPSIGKMGKKSKKMDY